MMKSFSFFPVGVLSLGLLTAQALSLFHVYLSNAELHATLTALNHAGFLTVPNLQIIKTLRQFSPAFFGGLFFTCTAGAALSLLTLGAVWLWDNLSSRNRYTAAFFLTAWLGSVFAVNYCGFNPFATSLFLVVPAVVIAVSLKWGPIQNGNILFNGMATFTPFVLLATFWLFHLDTRTFLNFRDHLFLSNPVGITLNDFYYKYTLYPAELIKSLDQKLIKTCDLASIRDVSLRPPLETLLLAHDYVRTERRSPADITVIKDGDTLVFENRGKEIYRTPINVFLLQPTDALDTVSRESDRNQFFRPFILASLLIGLPLAAYIYIHALFFYLSSRFLDTAGSRIAASTICFIAGLAMLMPVHLEKDTTVRVETLAAALVSEDWRSRMAGLKVLLENGMEIADHRPFDRIVNSPHIPERYWFVRTLGMSRKAETYSLLLGFLDDPSPNVVCMAFRSLGQRKNKTAVKKILQRIKTSDHWYEQWYAYKALRALGWKQTRLN